MRTLQNIKLRSCCRGLWKYLAFDDDLFALWSGSCLILSVIRFPQDVCLWVFFATLLFIVTSWLVMNEACVLSSDLPVYSGTC